MLEFIILLVGLFIGYHLGYMVLSWRLRDIIRDEARKEGIIVDDNYNIKLKKDTPTVFQLFVESTGGVFYLYNREKNEFVCQGLTIAELAELALKYKNIKYAAVLVGSDIVAFVDGKVRDNIV